jgi:hypothetical protein
LTYTGATTGAAITGVATGAVNLELLQKADPQLHAATVRQIQEFGQSPQQMFKQPHPHRLPLQQAELVWPLASQVCMCTVAAL